MITLSKCPLSNVLIVYIINESTFYVCKLILTNLNAVESIFDFFAIFIHDKDDNSNLLESKYRYLYPYRRSIGVFYLRLTLLLRLFTEPGSMVINDRKL